MKIIYVIWSNLETTKYIYSLFLIGLLAFEHLERNACSFLFKPKFSQTQFNPQASLFFVIYILDLLCGCVIQRLRQLSKLRRIYQR